MAQWLNWGDGHSGSPNAISGTVNTYATCTGTAGQTALTTTLSASAGDQILIHQSQGTGAGTWEICKVTSDAGSTLNLSTALVNSYSTGAQAVLIPQYTGGTISGAVTGTAWNGSVGGIVALMSNGDLTISGSITSSSGFIGGTSSGFDQTGYQGLGYTNAASAQSTSANTSGGGGGYHGGGDPFPGGGGGGGNGATGTTGGTGQGGPVSGAGGAASGNASGTNLTFGGGGGGGGTDGATVGGIGGAGSGMVFVFAKNLTVSGTINANGVAGVGNNNDGGGGGGGAGGSCLIKCQSAILGINKVTASGGSGGVSDKGGDGGAGGVGRIHCDYFTSVSGSTTPTLSSAQDLTLNLPSSNFFAFF